MITQADDEAKGRFLDLASNIRYSEHLRDSIGTYKEKTLHLFLKKFFEPDEAFHEVKVGPYVADIKNSEGIIEIQTAKFSSVSKRWSFFVDDNRVTVVYPIAGQKYVVWIDPEDGSVSDRRKSTKRGSALHILPELFGVSELFGNLNITFKCVIIELTEYRLKDGWGNEGKRGSHRYNAVPERLIDIVDLNSPSDISALLPFDSDTEFTSAEFRKACKFPYRAARALSASLKFLLKCGVIEQVGKRGNAYLYRKCSSDKFPSKE